MASGGKKISGIWVPLQLDITQAEKEIRDFAKNLGELSVVATEVGQAMDKSLNPKNLNSGIMQINRSLGALRDSARAFDALRPGQAFGQALTNLEPQLEKLAKTFGGTAEQQRELYTMMANTTAIKQQVTALNQLTRVLGTTREKTLELVRARGIMVSETAANDFLGVGKMKEANTLIQALTGRFKEFGAALGVTMGVAGLVSFSKEVINSALKMENLNLAFQSIYNSAGIAETQLKFVKDTSNALGLSFTETADGAKRLFASAQGTVLEDKAESIYLAFSKMGTALKLSGQDMDGVFLAISQTISKGKVSAEELRQQLAERMPGAVTLFAKSIGITVKELDKMLQDGAVGLEHFSSFAEAVNQKYSQGALTASKGLQSEIARVSNSWFELKSSLANTDTLADIVRKLGAALRILGDNSETVATVGANMAKWIGLTAGLYGVVKAITAIKAAVEATGGAVAVATTGWGKFAAVLSGARFLPLAGIIAGIGVAIANMASESSEGEKAFEKYAGEAYRLGDAIEGAKNRFDELADSAQANRLEGLRLDLEKTRKEFDSLFAPQGGGTGDPMADAFGAKNRSSVIEDYIRDIGPKFSAVQPGVKAVLAQVDEFAKSMQAELADALKQNETANLAGFFYDNAGLDDGLDKMDAAIEQAKQKFAEFREALEKSGASAEQLKKFDTLTQVLLASAGAAQKSAQALKGNVEVVNELDKMADAADNARGAIIKLTNSSDAAKFDKVSGEMNTLVGHLITISKYSIQSGNDLAEFNAQTASFAQTLSGSAEDTARFNARVAEGEEVLRKAKDSQEQLEQAMLLVGSQAQKSGMDINTLAQIFEQAAKNAGFTTEEIARLQAQLRQGFELAAAKKLEDEIISVQTKIKTVRATTAQSMAINALSKYFENAADASNLATAIMTGDQAKVREALEKSGKKVEELEKLYQGYMKLGQEQDAARSSGRSRSGGAGSSRTVTALQLEKKEMSELAKAADEVIKKTSQLGNFDGGKALEFSKSFAADLQKINHILEIGTGTEAEKARLATLIVAWEEAAKKQKEYLKNLDELKRMQDRANALSGGGGSNLFGKQRDMSYESDEVRKGAAADVRAKEADLLNSQDKAYKDGLISAEEYENNRINIHQQANDAIAVQDGNFLKIFEQSLDARLEKLKDWKEEIAETFLEFVDDAAGALADFVISGAQDFESLEKAFSDMVQSMLKDLTALFLKMAIFGTLKKVFENTSFGDSFGKLFGSAKGNVFSGISKYSNQVVTTPTIFSGQHLTAFARGGNIMGEAGPEAVIPLIRTPSGHLGVRAESDGNDAPDFSPQIQQAINVNVVNNAGAEVETQQTTDNQGNVDIDIMINKSVAKALSSPGSAPFRSMQSTWGGTPSLVQR